jgi:hypothetical protein
MKEYMKEYRNNRKNIEIYQKQMKKGVNAKNAKYCHEKQKGSMKRGIRGLYKNWGKKWHCWHFVKNK